jgi:hypothetical protein
MKLWMTTAALLLALTACGGDDSDGGGGGDDDSAAIKEAAQAYSDAFLTGDGDAAYALLSARCQERRTAGEFGAVVSMAAEQYGEALEFKTFDAEMNDAQARVTYTFEVAAINQADEPWVNEDGGWKNDDC